MMSLLQDRLSSRVKLTLSLSFALWFNLCASHEVVAQNAPGQGTFTAPTNIVGPGLLAQVGVPVRPNPIIPTDLVPLPASEERETFGDTIKLKTLQFLPAKLYFNANCETSFRNETNVFQTLTKRQTLRKLDIGPAFYELSAADQAAVLSPIRIVSKNDNVFRVFPNVTAGWAFTPRTRVYANYFFIRDNLFHTPVLNTNIQSVGGGIQHDFPLGKKANLQANLQFRELFQTNQIAVFDYLPGLTLSYYLTPRTVLYASGLLQMRGKQPFVAPNREIDPFYTFGGFYQKNLWSFSATATFLQNFREPFRKNALIPINNYSWILDFELDRQLSKKLPGAQIFVRAEPIYNFHSRGTTGLSGVDFRLFYGLKVAVGKQPLTAAMQLLRDQLQETSPAVPKPQGTSAAPPSALPKLPPPYVAHSMQPVHGVMDSNGATNSALLQVNPALAATSSDPAI